MGLLFVHTHATLTMRFLDIKFYKICNTEFGFYFEKLKL